MRAAELVGTLVRARASRPLNGGACSALAARFHCPRSRKASTIGRSALERRETKKLVPTTATRRAHFTHEARTGEELDEFDRPVRGDGRARRYSPFRR